MLCCATWFMLCSPYSNKQINKRSALNKNRQNSSWLRNQAVCLNLKQGFECFSIRITSDKTFFGTFCETCAVGRGLSLSKRRKIQALCDILNHFQGKRDTGPTCHEHRHPPLNSILHANSPLSFH